jgi:hypothetical protein
MLAWPIDNAFYFYVLFICLAAGFLAAWWQTRHPRWLRALAAVAGAAIVLVLLTLFVDTDRKKIERTLREMADNTDRSHLDRVLTHVSEKFNGKFMVHGSTVTWNKQQLGENARSACRRYGVDGVIVNDVNIDFISESEAVVKFRAKPVIDEISPLFPCEARFALESDGRWRMISLKIFNPFVNSTEFFNLPL